MEIIDYEKLVFDGNLRELNRIYRKLGVNGTCEERVQLADQGYLELFYLLNYDFACGKLKPRGLSLLLPMIKRVESLLKQSLWHERALAGLNLLENALKDQPTRVAAYAQAVMVALNHELATANCNKPQIYYNLALTYYYLAKHMPHQQVAHWRQAIEYLQESAQLNPVQTEWSFYLKLLYLPLPQQTADLTKAQHEARLFFQKLTLNLKENRAFAYQLASHYKDFFEYLQWYQLEKTLFPTDDYLDWLESAKEYLSVEEPSRLNLSHAGHFFYQEGVRLARVDLLEIARKHYQRLMELEAGDGFAVMYLADSSEVSGLIYSRAGAVAQAGDFYQQAREVYLEHLAVIKPNFSALIHYAEFLERCLDYPELMNKPKLSEMKELARLAEIEGKGFYSQPGMIQARLALREVDETRVIFYLTRELLLHELCMKNEFERCFADPRFTSLPQVHAFLLESINFMQEIEGEYYLDPVLKWEQLRKMNPEEVRITWEKRKIELKNRG